MKKPSPRSPIQNVYPLIALLTSLPKLISSYPTKHLSVQASNAATLEEPLTNQQYWTYLFISVVLVLTGGVFAGLTLGLMGQDEVYLKVISTSGEVHERESAKKVLQLIDRGKHWVLVTLLLSNVITNETLPIVLDRVLGGGWPAVVSSTASIVIFGEVIPQSLCVRYGLQIGAFFAPFVIALMYIMYPIAYPIAMLLDRILGEDHGTIYKKSGLKTLVTLHRTMGVERLNNDEVTIISAVLDLKEKKVCEIMIPLQNVYTMASDRILDERCVEEIFNSGFSRIPIHLPDEPTNFIGMLLVRVLISYDPEDALPVSSFPLATLPETQPDTSCLNILNYFQEGKSHMVVISETPGDSTGALGILTLEDVIEELIGEEIVDESDVFIDIHKSIKREQPGPLSKRHLTQYLHSLYTSNKNFLEVPAEESSNLLNKEFKPSNLASNPLHTDRSYVTIKRQPLLKSQSKFSYSDNSVEQQNVQQTLTQAELEEAPFSRDASPNYGTTYSTNSISKSSYRKFKISSNEKYSTDLSEYAATSLSKDSSLNHQHYQHANGDVLQTSQHSYRSGGGIVESIINVQGFNKTIIECNDDDDDNQHNNKVEGLLINKDPTL